jgi:hypothetical protein
VAIHNPTTKVEAASGLLSAQPGSNKEYIWQPQPLNVWIGMNPCNKLQLHVLHAIRERLEAQKCIFVPVPGQATELGPVAHLGIGFGSNLREEISPSAVFGRLPKPRGSVLMIIAVEHIPDKDLFGLARGQLVRKSGHVGMLIEGNLAGTKVKRALWASMAGNHSLLTGSEENIFDNLALRLQAHAGAEKISKHVGDDDTMLTWDEWCRSPVHHDIAQAGRILGQAAIIEDKIELDQYSTGRQAREVLRFLERGTLGEGMRSQLDPALGVMGVTTSGGGKINVDPDPAAGHIVPVGSLTWNGYIRAIPRDCPATYNGPSIETHENGLVYLAGALINAGLIDSFDSFLRYLKHHFAQHDRIAILPPGMQPKATAIEHVHRQPRPGSIKDPARVELVRPDAERFPGIDFPCGVRPAELQLLSAVFQSKAFREPGGRLDKVVIALLPGHGCAAIYGGPREELTDILVSGMDMEEPVRV